MPFSDLVFVIPGILGTRLARQEGAKKIPVWDLSVKRLPAAILEIVRGGLIFTGSGTAAPNDGIVTNGLLEIPQWLPGFFGVDGYSELVQRLKARLGADQVQEFPYDWRLSNIYTAGLLKKECETALTEWRAKSGNAAAKLVLIGHSMGGMIARYYCEALGGAAYVRTVVTIGTPHRGAIPALDGLVNGKKLLKIFDMSKELRSLPSVYDLLPTFPCFRRDGAQPQKIGEIAKTVPFLDEGRWKQAVTFHEGIATPALTRAEKGEPCPYEQIVFFSQRQPTLLSARLQGDGSGMEALADDPVHGAQGLNAKSGDGTVPWFSALPIEWSDDGKALAAPGKHAALQTAETVVDTIAGWLNPTDATVYKGASAGQIIQLRLSSPVMATTDTLAVEARTDSPGTLGVTVTLCEESATPRRQRVAQLPPGGGVAEFDGLAEGVHEIVVGPIFAGQRDKLPPVNDYVLVLKNG